MTGTFSEEARSYSETRKRTGAEYVKFTQEHRTVLRMLNPMAKTVWKHYIRAANDGRGMGAVCPNVAADIKVCPIEASVATLPKDDPERREKIARRKFVVNVLDRTPHTTCKSCNNVTPGVVQPATGAKVCQSCKASLKGHDFTPLNKVKILESGPKLFNQSLNPIQQMQREDFDGAEITDYDITFTAQGELRDRVVTAIPQEPKPLPEEALVDPETGERQKLFDLDLLSEPATVEEIEAMLNGATIEQLNAIRGIE